LRICRCRSKPADGIARHECPSPPYRRLLQPLLQLRATGGLRVDQVDERSSSGLPRRLTPIPPTTINALITRRSEVQILPRHQCQNYCHHLVVPSGSPWWPRVACDHKHGYLSSLVITLSSPSSVTSWSLRVRRSPPVVCSQDGPSGPPLRPGRRDVPQGRMVAVERSQKLRLGQRQEVTHRTGPAVSPPHRKIMPGQGRQRCRTCVARHYDLRLR
jgi:hypothetical protein